MPLSYPKIFKTNCQFYHMECLMTTTVTFGSNWKVLCTTSSKKYSGLLNYYYFLSFSSANMLNVKHFNINNSEWHPSTPPRAARRVWYWKISLFFTNTNPCCRLAVYEQETLKKWWNVHITRGVIIKRFSSAIDTKT